MTDQPPHNLSLYQQAVQHPLAEAFFLCNVYEQYNDCQQPVTLREDFCGSAAISLGWIMADPNRKAIAIDNDPPTIDFAQQQINDQLGHAAKAISLICDDVQKVTMPKADIIASMNFSTLIYHDRSSLFAYFKQSLANLNEGGIFVMDLFGGPGAMQASMQSRPMSDEHGQSFTYQWEQKSFDCMTHRIDCRIHFTLADGTQRQDAFVYDWRLWSIPEILELLNKAGYSNCQVWCDTFDADHKQSDGQYVPIDELASREDWVVYITGQR